jgi:hypothetical protein
MMLTTEAQRTVETGSVTKVGDDTELDDDETDDVERDTAHDEQALGLTLSGLGVLAGALKQTRGARIANILAKKSTRSASRAAKSGIGKAKQKGGRLLDGAKTFGDRASKTGVGQGTQVSTNDKGETEADSTLEWSLKPFTPVELMFPAIPGLSLSAEPAVKLVAHGVGTDKPTTFKLNVEGNCMTSLNYGIPKVLQAYGGCNGVVTGGGTLKLEAPKWELGAEIEASSVLQVGFKYLGFGDANYKLAEAKLFTISGLGWSDKGPQCDPKIKWHPEIEAFFAQLQKAAKHAEDTVKTITNPAQAAAKVGANLRRLFPF